MTPTAETWELALTCLGMAGFALVAVIRRLRKPDTLLRGKGH